MSWAGRNWFVIVEYSKADKRYSKVLTDDPMFGFKKALYRKRLLEKENQDKDKFYKVVSTNY
jgi:hypothetical protein